MTEYLSEDCITEILCRLPITALVGFECVCKSWNILISDVCIPRISRASSPLFGLLFRTRNPSNRNEYFMNYVSYSDDDSNYIAANGFVESYSSLLPSENAPYDLLDYCNGFILLASQIGPCYYVCNPATKQYVGIPHTVHIRECIILHLPLTPRKPHILNSFALNIRVLILPPIPHCWTYFRLKLERGIGAVCLLNLQLPMGLPG